MSCRYARLRHPGCLRLFAFSVNIELVVTMVVELCPYSLEDIRVACDSKESVRTRLPIVAARKMYWQILQAMKYLHNFAYVRVSTRRALICRVVKNRFVLMACV